MAVVWTLDINGEVLPLAEWKIVSPVLQTANLSRDTLTFETPGAFDGDPLCAFGDPVILYRNGVKWFQGECFVVPRGARGASERQSYSFVGPWNFLERNVMKAPWFIADNGSTQYTSHLIFLAVSVADNITNILEYAIARGANLQVGTITAPLIPPAFEVTDLTCAGAIQRIANYAPDCIGYFDYTTTPPTFHFKPRSALTAVELSLPDEALPFGSRLEIIEPIAREDLVVDNVQIIYEREDTIDGQRVFNAFLDSYPPSTNGLEDGCLSAIVMLQGGSTTTVRGNVLADEIQPDSIEWWKKVCPKLNDPRIGGTIALAFADSSIDRIGYDGEASEGYPNRILGGAVTPWMELENGDPVLAQKEKISRLFRYSMATSHLALGGMEHVVEYERIEAEVTATNSPVGDILYSTTASIEEGEAIPTGLAEYLYNALHPLQYDVLLQQHKADCDGEVKLGNVVNILNGHDDWEDMNAVVQQVSFDIDHGTAEITCGPPRHLTIDQILELLRVSRIRRRWTNPSVQNDGILSGRDIELGKETSNNNATHGLPELSRFIVTDGGSLVDLNAKEGEERIFVDFGSGKTLTVELDDAIWAAAPEAARALAIRAVCVRVGGVNKTMLVVGGAPYDS